MQGEAGYSMRLMDIRTLKLKCGDLMRDLAIARGSSNQMDDLRREVFQLQRDLLQVLRRKLRTLVVHSPPLARDCFNDLAYVSLLCV